MRLGRAEAEPGRPPARSRPACACSTPRAARRRSPPGRPAPRRRPRPARRPPTPPAAAPPAPRSPPDRGRRDQARASAQATHGVRHREPAEPDSAVSVTGFVRWAPCPTTVLRLDPCSTTSSSWHWEQPAPPPPGRPHRRGVPLGAGGRSLEPPPAGRGPHEDGRRRRRPRGRLRATRRPHPPRSRRSPGGSATSSSACSAMRNASHFGGPPVDYFTKVWPATAADALAELDAEYARWIGGRRRPRTTTPSPDRSGPSRGPVRRAPRRRPRCSTSTARSSTTAPRSPCCATCTCTVDDPWYGAAAVADLTLHEAHRRRHRRRGPVRRPAAAVGGVRGRAGRAPTSTPTGVTSRPAPPPVAGDARRRHRGLRARAGRAGRRAPHRPGGHRSRPPRPAARRPPHRPRAHHRRATGRARRPVAPRRTCTPATASSRTARSSSRTASPTRRCACANPARRLPLVGAPDWLDELPLEPGPPWLDAWRPATSTRRSWLIVDDDRDRDLVRKAVLLDERHARGVRRPRHAGGGRRVARGARAGAWPRPGPTRCRPTSTRSTPPAGSCRRTSASWCCATARPHLDAASLCFPSYWRLADKLGRPMADVHGPVAHYADELAAKVDTFLQRLRPERPVWRRNWSIHDDPSYFLPDPTPALEVDAARRALPPQRAPDPAPPRRPPTSCCSRSAPSRCRSPSSTSAPTSPTAWRPPSSGWSPAMVAYKGDHGGLAAQPWLASR